MIPANPKIPPYSEESESGVLGSILLSPDVALYKAIDAGVTEESFYNKQNGALFANIVELEKTGRPVDAITISEWLKDNDALDQVGGFDRLLHLQDVAIVAAHVEHYANSVIEHHRLRTIIATANDIIERAFKKDSSNDIIGQASIAFENSIEGGSDERTTKQIAKELIELDQKIIAGESIGLPFPWRDLQSKTYGIPYSAVSPLAGRDGKGKSRLATFLAVRWACSGFPGLIFPFEDTELRCLRNASANFSEYDAFHVNGDHPSPQFIDKHISSIKRTAELPLYICDYANKIDRIISTIATHKRKYDIKWVVIDGFKDVHSSGGENRTQEEVRMMRALTACARKYKVAIIPVMHLNKVSDDKWISKQEITGSGDQTKSARMVMVYQDYVPEEIKSKVAPGVYDDNLFVLDVQKASYGSRALHPLIKNLEQGKFEEVEDL